MIVLFVCCLLSLFMFLLLVVCSFLDTVLETELCDCTTLAIRSPFEHRSRISLIEGMPCVSSRQALNQAAPNVRLPCTWHFRAHATSAPAELGGEIHSVSRNRARTQVLLQARRLHVCGSGTFDAFWM